MHITRERVRQITLNARERQAALEATEGRSADPTQRWGQPALWHAIDGFGDIVAQPMITEQGLAELMPSLVEEIRKYRLERARRLAFVALWPDEDADEREDFYEEEEFEDEGPSERELAYEAFELSAAQRALVDRTAVGRDEVLEYVSGPGRPHIRDGMPGIALPGAFKLRMTRFPYARRNQIAVELGPDTSAVHSLAASLVGERLAEPRGPMFSDFLSFWAEERAKYAAPGAVPAVESGAISLAWPSIVERDERILFDASDFRSRRDRLAVAQSHLAVEELVWAGFGAWAPPEGLITAVAEFWGLRTDPGEYQYFLACQRRRIAAARRRALREQMLLERSGSDNATV